MALVWSPDPASVPWHDVQADEVWSGETISASDAEGLLTVLGYTCEVIGADGIDMVVQAGASGVSVAAPRALTHAFPHLDIEYVAAGISGHCVRFDDLPAEAEQVVRFVPNPSSSKDWTLRVGAHCADAASGAKVTFTSDFVLRVWTNLDIGRDALKAAVNARRR